MCLNQNGDIYCHCGAHSVPYAFVEGAKIVEGITMTDNENVVGKITFSHDPVEFPAHYLKGGIDTFDFIKAKGLTYEEGNIVKYVVRSRHKGNRLEDLKKASWYLRKLIEEAEKNG